MQAQTQIQAHTPGRPGRPFGSRNTPPQGMVDVQGLGEMLGYSPATIRRYAAVTPWKLPPRLTWPGKILWSITTIDAWLAQRVPALPPTIPVAADTSPPQGVDLNGDSKWIK